MPFKCLSVLGVRVHNGRHERDSCRAVSGGVRAFTMPRKPALVLNMGVHNEAPAKPL